MGLIARRLTFSLLAALVAIIMSLWWQQAHFVDLFPPIEAARRLLSGIDPYSTYAFLYRGLPNAPYPLTSLIALSPFALFPGQFAIAAAWGTFNGLLVYGMLKVAKPWRFLIFLTTPYILAFCLHQFSVLMAAIYLLPSLLPLTLVKPQGGIPIILVHLTKRRLLWIVGFVLITVLIYPAWPLAWWHYAKNYDGIIPLLLLPLGPLMVVALLKWREKDTAFLFLMACMPQRVMYDIVPLYLLPKSFRQMAILCILSWATFIPLLFMVKDWWFPEQQVRYSLIACYLPLLVMQVAPVLSEKAKGWLAFRSNVSENTAINHPKSVG